MAEIVKQSHRPFESPYEQTVVLPPPEPVYTARPVTCGGPSFRLGRLRITAPGVIGACVDRPVDHKVILQKFKNYQGIINGGIQSVGAGMPGYFNRPDRAELIEVKSLDNKVLTVNYKDNQQKHPDLNGPYEVTIVLEMICSSPEVEALADPDLRRRIYEDLMLSGYSHIVIDPEKYLADANYSAASDTSSRLAAESFIGSKNFLEPNL